MFYNYKILEVNNEEVLYLYVNSIYEFSSELGHFNRPKTIFNKVTDYIKDMNIKFEGKKVMLVVNGIIIGSIMLINNDFKDIDNKNMKNEFISYNETIDLDKNDNIDIIDLNKDIKDYIKEEVTNNDGYIVSNFVKMKSKDGRITFIDLNNYITNCLTKIIPPTYEEEAIKSAIVITRTYVFRELYENNYLSEDGYIDNNTLKKLWKKNYNIYLNKLKSLVEETSYQYLSNNNYYFNFNTREKYQVPFSSYDANKLAKLGYNYIDILSHYYPDATLEVV